MFTHDCAPLHWLGFHIQAHHPHPLEHPDPLRKPMMKPLGNNRKQQASKSLQELATTTQRPQSIIGNHQKVSDKKGFCGVLWVFWEDASLDGSHVFGP